MGWVQQPMAWWGVAAHGGWELWSLVGPRLALAIPTCSRWWGWSSPWLPGCPEAGVPTVGRALGRVGWSLGRHLVQLWGAAPLTSGDLSL